MLFYLTPKATDGTTHTDLRQYGTYENGEKYGVLTISNQANYCSLFLVDKEGIIRRLTMVEVQKYFRYAESPELPKNPETDKVENGTERPGRPKKIYS